MYIENNEDETTCSDFLKFVHKLLIYLFFHIEWSKIFEATVVLYFILYLKALSFY